MNVFDIIGPVMIGPSSSHTAGAARIGLITRHLLGEEPVSAVIRLFGSFAETYRGHGTDRAIVGGLLGMKVDDPGLRGSLETARTKGVSIEFVRMGTQAEHPNTVEIEARAASGKKIDVLACSTGGGNVLFKRVNGLEAEFTAQFNTLAAVHRDTPGVIASMTEILSRRGINIAFMKVYRSSRGGDAVAIIETDEDISPRACRDIEEIPAVHSVMMIHKV